MNEFRVEEWTVKESELLGEMKDRCLKGGQYIDEKAKEKFKMLCHLEDYCIQYYQLLDYINQLEKNIDDAIGYIKYCQISDKDVFPVIEAEKMTEILKGGF